MSRPTRPLVSVIVPVYNVERYLDECMDSIRQQTYPHLEIIVVEDCSTDGSLRALEPHLADPRVCLLRHVRNGGLSSARNTGIEAATGDYLMFVDSDDVVDAGLVEACLDAEMQTGADVVLYGFTVFRDGYFDAMPAAGPQRLGRIMGAEYFELPHFAWLKFMRTSMLKNTTLRFPVDQYYEDWLFHWEIGFAAHHMEQLHRPLYHYRQRNDSITASAGKKLFHIFSAHQLLATVIKKHAAAPDIRRALAMKINRGIWYVLITIEAGLLNEAIWRARQHLSVMREHRRHGSPNFKNAALLLALRLPPPIALAAVHAIRIAATALSPSRRNVRRNTTAAA